MESGAALDAVHGSSLPTVPELAQVNKILVPLGPSPGRAWLVMRREDLDSISLDNLHTIDFNFTDDADNKQNKTFRNWCFAAEPLNLTPSLVQDDPEAIFLCTLADSRWRVSNPIFCTALNRQYNVRAPAYRDSQTVTDRYLASTLTTKNGQPALWTWLGMLQDLWSVVAPIVGGSLTLPVTPDGNPEGYVFQGVDAWLTINAILAKIGCAITTDPSATTSQYSVVQVGAGNPLSLSQSLQIHRDERQGIKRGYVPAGVRVHFHALYQGGTEQTVTRTSSAWQTTSVYTIDVAAPSGQGSSDTSVYHPLWDDTPALYDASTGNLTNNTQLKQRAKTRAADYFRMLNATGGRRRWERYTGLLDITPDASLKGVSWCERPEPEGVFTEIVNHPFLFMRANEEATWEVVPDDSARWHAPDLRPTWPPSSLEPTADLRLNNPTPSSGVYDMTVMRGDGGLGWVAGQDVWGQNVRGTPVLMDSNTDLTNAIFTGCRLKGYYNGRPLFTFIGILYDPTITCSGHKNLIT